MYCPRCCAPTRWVREITPEKVLLAVLTLGLWLLHDPFHKRRCAECGLYWSSDDQRAQIMATLLE